MSLKTAISSFKQLLGLQAKLPPPQSLLQKAAEAYSKVPDSEKQQFIQSTLDKSSLAVATALTNKDKAGLKEALEHAEVVVYFTKEKLKGVTLPLDKPEHDEVLKALDTIVELIKVLAVPGTEFLKNLENYLHRYEENLELTEARGEYKVKISENQEWVRLPLLEFLPKKMDKKTPTMELKKIFTEIPQAKHLELDSRVPMRTTSLVDVEHLIADKQVVPVFIKDPEQFYVLIV